MRYFTFDYPLSRASVGIRLVLTLFLFFMLLGTITSVLIFHQNTQFSYRRMVDYYRGAEEGMLFPKSYAELLQTTHFHLFSMPVVMLILGHIFLMVSWSIRARVTVILLSFAGMLFELAGPWLMRYGSENWGWVLLSGECCLAVSLTCYIVVPLWEMWFRRTA
ncbi:MAG TPA: hypothetical protein VGK99_14475 [Acidobacteriota bacterium]|jgi:hypothetical protein